jgi:sigma-B regulation protein RsbU (phosphoserine phosphatase)
LSIAYFAAAEYRFSVHGSWYPVVIPLFFQAPLAFLGAVGLEHGRLFKEVIEKLRMEEDLSVARDVQMSMLPGSCPEIEGYEIAAGSTPAREVGGDFFDFIELGERKLGLVLGDVTGKSVSGALIMSASRSVFRMLSEENYTVGEIMIRANRRTKEDITKGMFVALLYAVLDVDERALSVCSAGQTQPILLSGKTGRADLVETQGDNFPLGILDEADYKETRMQLTPGDTVVFYTDGIVEAMNQREEVFGFQRLLQVVENSRSKTGEALLKEIVDRAREFAKGASQHDDQTVIVVRVTG